MTIPLTMAQDLRALADRIESGEVKADSVFAVAITAVDEGNEVRVKNHVLWCGAPTDARVFVAAVRDAVGAVIQSNINAGNFIPDGEMPGATSSRKVN